MKNKFNDCGHHWLIKGEVGTCKICGKTKLFRNVHSQNVQHFNIKKQHNNEALHWAEVEAGL